MFSSNASLLLAEAGVYLCAASLAVAFPRFHPAWVRGFEEAFRGLARRRVLSVVFVIGFVLAVRGLLLPLLPPPVPGVNDEFSYILAADTFASGRPANPTHAVWKSLETFYVIQTPTYASMYPPAQGLALAAGYLLARNPWVGVYISVALMCGAICWMLQGYVPPAWALTGALIAALRWGIYSYWMESYWGGAVAAAGGALVAGAMPRLLRARSMWPALGLGSGLLILANSRPFEGGLFSATVILISLGRALRQKNTRFRPLVRTAALPLAAILTCGGAAMAWYFWRVTGSPLTMPYQLHSATYEVTGPFLWQPLRTPPFYRYAVMETYHMGRQTAAFLQAHTLPGWLSETWRKTESLVVFYFWPAVLPVATAIPFLLRDARARLALVAAFAMLAGLSLEIWPMTPHYHAPLAGLMVLLLVEAMRRWAPVAWRGRPVGAAVARTVPLFCAALLAFRLSAAVLHVPVPEHGLAPWFTVAPGNLQRAELQKRLEAQPGLHLAIVHYGATHHDDEEWVHNAASIDASKVVWARYGTPEDNARLLEYFRNRRVWRVDVEARSFLLTPVQPPRSARIDLRLSSGISH